MNIKSYLKTSLISPKKSPKKPEQGISYTPDQADLVNSFKSQGKSNAEIQREIDGLRGGGNEKIVKELENIGVKGVGHKVFSNGDIVPFSFPSKGGSDVYGFLQYENGKLKLTSQIFSINDTSGMASLAFRKFLNDSKSLAKTLGAKQLELQGGSVINSSLKKALLERGFETKTIPVPDVLGGGTQEVLFKIFDLTSM